MDAKVKTHVTLDFKLILRAQFLKNRFITIFYSILFVLFAFISLGVIRAGDRDLYNIVLDIMLTILCAIVGFGYPVFSAFLWKIRTKKKYGTDKLELEYHFYDLSLRVENKTAKIATKLDYRAISRLNQSKHLLILNYSPKVYVVIDKDQMNAKDIEKVLDYFKRLKLV